MALGEGEAFFPAMPEAFTGSAPGIENLARHRSGRLDFSDHVVIAKDECRGGIAVGLLGLAFGSGEAAISHRDDGLLRAGFNGVGGLQHRGEAGADRAGAISRADLGRE